MSASRVSNAGFSLIENILAIVLSSIVVAGMVTIFYPLAQKVVIQLCKYVQPNLLK